MSEATWKAHPIHVNYEASTDGRARSTDRIVHRSDGSTRFLFGQELKPYSAWKNRGILHPTISLGRNKRIFLHRFVCEAFHGLAPSTRHRVSFLNGDEQDCSPTNLAWVYPADEHHSQWQGADVGYDGLHKRIKKQRGPAQAHSCVDCGRQAAHWSYDHTDPAEKRGPDGPYSVDMDRYDPRCRRCHVLFDKRGNHAERAS